VLEPFTTAGSLHDLIASAFEYLPEHIARQHVVVNEEYACHAFGFPGSALYQYVSEHQAQVLYHKYTRLASPRRRGPNH
jgi:hypothetical protein